MFKTRRGGITLVELLVIIAVVGIIAALFLPATGNRPPMTDEDLHLDDWQPGPEHSATPTDSIRMLDIDLEGVWTDQIGWLDLTIKPLADGRYDVSFLSHGRCGLGGSVQLERFADYEDGVLLLNRPVQELTGATYQQVYSVRINDTLCLVPSIRIVKVHADTSEFPYRGVLARNAQQ